MEFRTIVDIPKPGFTIEPTDRMLFVGSCFAENIGRKFIENKFRCVVNPYGTMYNPASVLHTVERFLKEQSTYHKDLLWNSETTPLPLWEGQGGGSSLVLITLGTNHVYILKETNKIVDNCQKRPQKLFREEELSVDACADYLQQTIDLLRQANPNVKVILTVSPIRYAKYGYHESQLSKATLLLAVDKVLKTSLPTGEGRGEAIFPSYEILNDELRDYRFYASDMLHPSEQAVEYIYERFSETYFSDKTKQFVNEWQPIKQALNHRPFNPDSEEYKKFLAKAKSDEEQFIKKWYNLDD